MRNWLLPLLLFLLACPVCADQTIVSSDPDGAGPFPAMSRVGDTLVVHFRDIKNTAELKLWDAQYGVTTEWVLESHGLATVRVDEGRLPGVLQQIQRDPFVTYACPDYIIESSGHAGVYADSRTPEPARGFPNDPRYKDQWHLGMQKASKAWKKATGKGVTVAVVDSGIAYTEKGSLQAVEDLAQTRFVQGYDFVNGDELAVDDCGYGTHLAGTVAQSTNNGIGVAGLAYEATLMPVKVLSSKGKGTFSGCAAGIRFAADQNADIILLGFGSSHDNLLLESAVEYASDQGALVIAPVGVEGQPEPGFPAAYPQVIGVGAVDIGRKITSYSNKGADITAPGGYARGGQGILQNTIHAGNPGRQGYLWLAGTNCAAANVAGTAALVMSAGVREPSRVREILFSTANKQKDKNSYGAGIVQADKAVAKAQKSTSTEEMNWLWLMISGLMGVLLLKKLKSRTFRS